MYVDSCKSSNPGGKLLSKVCVRYRSVDDKCNRKQSENIQLHITSLRDKFLTTEGSILNIHKVTEERELALQQVL
jgi:hypothetical protein